jgi:alpha-galactosidase
MRWPFLLKAGICAIALLAMPGPGRSGEPSSQPPAAPSQPVIVATEKPTGWRMETVSSVYQVALADDGIVIPVYYGPKAAAAKIYRPPVSVNPKVGSRIREVPFRGGFIEQTPLIELVFADGCRDTELIYAGSQILQIDGSWALRIDLEDPAYDLGVAAYFRVLPELDVIQKWLVIENRGETPIRVENAMSSSIWLPPDEYELYHLAGRWGHEFMLYQTLLTPGVKTIQTRDFVAHANPPWFAVGRAGETSETVGPVWFGSLHYSGNWRLDFEKAFAGNVQIAGGINFWDTSKQLEPHQQFTTPKMVLGLATDGLGGASTRMHRYVREQVLRERFRDVPRPVLYNSWYATTFDVTEKGQLELAQTAKEIGVELFVIDDGWFQGRVNDKAGLGDWTVDRNKFPQGLGPMIEKINALGLDFGLWVEPEMVNPQSDLYRAHPDWVLHYPKRTRHEQRNQLTLNLAREDVCEYLFESLGKLLEANNIRFIKWDRNRPLSEPGWPDAPAGGEREVRLRYVENLYRLIDRLQERFPNVWFETCSGGGGRCDLGMLQRMDQAWTSDNTDPADRLLIQHGYSHALPANTMVNWVTDKGWHQDQTSLEFRFHVAMTGVLGVGNDLAQWSPEDRRTAAQCVAQYKAIRPLVQAGVLHRLLSPVEGERVALEYADPQGGAAVVFLFNLREYMEGRGGRSGRGGTLRLRGLDPAAQYRVSGAWSGTIDGNTLMNLGIPWFLRGNFRSAVLTLQRL